MSDKDDDYVSPVDVPMPEASYEVVQETFQPPTASVESVKANEQPQASTDRVRLNGDPDPSTEEVKKGL